MNTNATKLKKELKAIELDTATKIMELARETGYDFFDVMDTFLTDNSYALEKTKELYKALDHFFKNDKH